MRITFVGTGTCVPTTGRAQPAVLLERKGKKMLVDCGDGTVAQLWKLGIIFWDIDSIFITHYHADHFGGLMFFITALHVAVMNYPKRRSKPLYIYGPVGFKKVLNTLRKIMFHEATKDSYNVVPVEIRKSMTINGVKVSTFKPEHRKESIGYRFEFDEKSVVYTGDTAYTERIVEAARNADMLIAECTFPNGKKNDVHLDPQSLGEIATKANAKMVVPVHINELFGKDQLRKELKDAYKGKIIIPKDGMKITI